MKSSNLAEKSEYAELTDKQQNVVDAYVANPNARNSDIADISGASEAYVYNVLSTYDDIVEDQIYLDLNGREEGEVITDSPDSIDELFEELETGENEPQSITERPVKGDVDEESTGSVENTTSNGVLTFTVELTQKEARDLMMREVTQGSVDQTIVNSMVEQLFS